MNTQITMRLNVTKEEEKTIILRAKENGFDDVLSYVKVVALKTQPFSILSTPSKKEETLIELSFKVTPLQEIKIQENIKESQCESLEVYLKYVALHSVVTAVVEVRSTGSFEEMLARISATKKSKR